MTEQKIFSLLSIEDVKLYDGIRKDGAVVGLYHISQYSPRPGSCGYSTWLRNDVVHIRNVA